jgi:hypothetical protein
MNSGTFPNATLGDSANIDENSITARKRVMSLFIGLFSRKVLPLRRRMIKVSIRTLLVQGNTSRAGYNV